MLRYAIQNMQKNIKKPVLCGRKNGEFWHTKHNYRQEFLQILANCSNI